MANRASITDTPILSNSENLLGIENYAQALGDFILESATPLTVGIQGQWGTGKTSMMNLIQEMYVAKDVAISWVNTWEYSLFKEANETTPKVLRGMLETLKEACGDQWSLSDDLSQRIKKVSSFLGNLANQAVAGKTGLDVKAAVGSNKSSTYTEVAQIKMEINSIIHELIEDSKNKYKKVVFFLDDLDRIDPTVAVEILEALKNIFDIKNCVFVLAIDYNVVIKGLEKKFGKKTDQNEREFRSFFDKIIQVPFSMPIGAYCIDNLLKRKFSELELEIDAELEESFLSLVSLTVGYIPRSIKRYINTYSLLTRIKKQSQDEENPFLNFCLFALIGCQISYPEIFRLINKSPDFQKWDERFAKKHGVDDLSTIDSDYKLTDETWEKFLYLYCQEDVYLKSRVYNILDFFNLLRDTAGDDLMDAMNGALNFASITRVDDNIESKEIEHVLQSVTERIKFFGESAKKRLARVVKRSSMSDNLSQDE